MPIAPKPMAETSRTLPRTRFCMALTPHLFCTDASACGSPAPGGGLQRRADPAVLRRVDRDAGRDYLVDAVEHVVAEHDVGGGQLRLEMVHGARADDRRGDRGVAQHEGDRQLDQRETGVVGELGELLDGLEL